MNVRRLRLVASIVFVAAAVAAAVYAGYRNRNSLVSTLHQTGPWPVVASVVLGSIGTGFTYPVWRTILGGLGVDLPFRSGARVYFVSQLGKYVPGSIWPVVMQMEAGHARGASRRTMLAGNLVALATSCAVGLSVACILLPSFDTDALRTYWWVLIALPFLLALLHPRVIPAIIDRVFALFGRPPLAERIRPGATVRAAAWSVPSWIFLGSQLAVLCWGTGQLDFSTWVLCTGAMALALCAGVLFIPAPAGAGIRDVILVLILRSIVDTGTALAIVLYDRGSF